jgi:adenylate cyclase
MGVNLAFGIYSLGMAGSILFSEKVNNELLNQPDLPTVLVGTYQFKNILRLVEVFALNHPGLVIPAPNPCPEKPKSTRSPGGRNPRLYRIKASRFYPF